MMLEPSGTLEGRTWVLQWLWEGWVPVVTVRVHSDPHSPDRQWPLRSHNKELPERKTGPLWDFLLAWCQSRRLDHWWWQNFQN